MACKAADCQKEIDAAVAAEREACAKVVDDHANGWLPCTNPVSVCRDLAAAICARGK